ncbi:hypothetical protein B0I37DRAFT_422372 [Chaetomium sp. MPI-CAGE-AT-0009]|nr:hypothetical protein B0I37DRAFT_422372 [Chaetomium sp. MPI-CAGE-AT-0009]
MAERAEGDDAGRENKYRYIFEADGRRFLFIRNIGGGFKSVVQLVKDVETGKNIVRKADIDGKLHHQDPEGGTKYHSVSYWKLCNGGSVREWRRRPAIDGRRIHAPTSIFARMIRQVLSAFQWMYTAGPDPLYHLDVHAGNIWINWPRDTGLPDFYLGDFGSARFAHDAPDICAIAKMKAPEPVDDLNELYDIFYTILVIDREHLGHGDPDLLDELRQLCGGIAMAARLWESAGNKAPPPDLRPLIRQAKNLEDKYGKGGEADETRSSEYMKFITESCRMAFVTEDEQALVVVAANIEDAQHPTVMGMSAGMHEQIHGPWRLVTVDGYWDKGGPVTHHRPNERIVYNPDKEVDPSITKRRSLMSMGSLPSGSDDPSPQPGFSFPGGNADGSATAVDTQSPPRTLEAIPEAAWQPGEHDPQMFEKLSLGSGIMFEQGLENGR